MTIIDALTVMFCLPQANTCYILRSIILWKNTPRTINTILNDGVRHYTDQASHIEGFAALRFVTRSSFYFNFNPSMDK